MKNLSYKKVIEAFVKGEEGKTANGSLKSVNKVNADGEVETQLIGYGWAIYATRWNGQFYIYQEWDGYSVTTSKHMHQLRFQAGQAVGPQGVCMSVNGKPQL